MIYPEFIKKRDSIGVTACSDGRVEQPDIARLEHARVLWEECGYLIKETANVRTSSKGRSSSAAERAKQFNDLLVLEEVKAIFMVAGGDYLLEMIPLLDYEFIRNHPKWIQGFSDPTGLLYTITTNCDLATLYAGNFSEFGMDRWHASLETNKKILEGHLIIQNSFDQYVDGYKQKVTGLEEYEFEKTVQWKNLNSEDTICMEGRMLGGCLDVLLNLVGTKYDNTARFIEHYREDGILWYLESFALNAETLTCGLWNLREAGWFKYAKGFVFGRPAFFSTSTDTSYEEVLHSVLDELQVPIILEADFGHKPPRMTIVNGAIGKILSTKGTGSFEMSFR